MNEVLGEAVSSEGICKCDKDFKGTDQDTEFCASSAVNEGSSPPHTSNTNKLSSPLTSKNFNSQTFFEKSSVRVVCLYQV